MLIYTFENLDPISGDTSDLLFQKSMVNYPKSIYSVIFVGPEYEGRLDLISMYLYGSTDYVEELMTINNIINPWSVKAGDVLSFYKTSANFSFMYQKEASPNKQKDEILLMNKNKSTTVDSNRLGSPPTIKPDNLKQLDVNYNKKKITIINKFK